MRRKWMREPIFFRKSDFSNRWFWRSRFCYLEWNLIIKISSIFIENGIILVYLNLNTHYKKNSHENGMLNQSYNIDMKIWFGKLLNRHIDKLGVFSLEKLTNFDWNVVIENCVN